MFHACFMTLPTCFVHTLCHIYAFSGTNLLTRCRSASSCFLLFLVSEILVRKYSRNWTKSTPRVLKLHEASRTPESHQRGATGPPDHRAARPRGGAPPYGVTASSALRLRLFAYIKVPDLNLRYEKATVRETFQSRRHREAKIWGTEVSVPARRRDGEVPPEGFFIDTTAIFITAAVSHEEGVVLHRG